MAARRRRRKTSSSTRRTTRRRANPNPFFRRRRRSTRRRRHNPNPGLFTRHHRGHRRHHARRRNPAGIVGKGLSLAVWGAIIQFTLGFIPPIGGVSAVADAARTFGVGWGLSLITGRIGFTRAYSQDAMLAGATLAGGKLISAFILPFASRIFPGAQQGGLSGIAVTHGIPPSIVPLPLPAENQQGGMAGIGLMPGRFAR